MKWLTDAFHSAAPVEKLIMVHTAALDKARELWDTLSQMAPDLPEPLFLDVTPVLGAHLGPGVVGFTAVTAAVPIED